MSTRVAMVAGEPSGDLIAARVMQGMNRLADGRLHIEGIGGPHMQGEGMKVQAPLSTLSVFGYADALMRLPSLWRVFQRLKTNWLQHPPDVFVGVDAPDFNLRMALPLRRAGIPTVQFVSPSIWAWRYQRIHRIREAVSHMLVLFPFEEAIYQREGIPVTYVGHPLARDIPMLPDRLEARRYLKVPEHARVLAVLPGSRASEIKLLGPRFFEAVKRLQARDPDLHVLIPMANSEREAQCRALLRGLHLKHCHVLTPVSVVDHHVLPSGRMQRRLEWPVAWHALEAADAALVASGTATLETALFKRPMVISYVLSPAARRIMAWQAGQAGPSLPWVGLPNILANDTLVPELLQDQATPQALADAVWQALTDTDQAEGLAARFAGLHEQLRRDTPTLAARAILAEAGHAY